MATQEQKETDTHCSKLLSSYLGFSFSIFLGLLPKKSISLLSRLQNENKDLSFKVIQAEEQLKQLHSRRREDSKANAKVVEIFASQRHSWQQEQKRLLQHIDECDEEMTDLKGQLEEFERVESELKTSIEDLKTEIMERDEMLNFMSRNNCETVGVDDHGFSPDFLSSAASRLWYEKASLFQDIQYEPVEPIYHMKHFVSRRESPWKVDSESSGVSSKLKLVEQELLDSERVCKVPASTRKLAKRYRILAGKMDDLCHRMQACDPCDSTMSSEFRTQRQTEFLLEAFRLQQHASETRQKLTGLQSEVGQVKISMSPGVDSIRSNFKDIQRSIEIWLARIIGDLEGIMARDGASHATEYYVSRGTQLHVEEYEGTKGTDARSMHAQPAALMKFT